jgi:hypothetical protein
MDDMPFPGIQVHVIAEVLHVEPPTERRLEVYLERMRTDWEGVQTVLHRSLREQQCLLHELAAMVHEKAGD